VYKRERLGNRTKGEYKPSQASKMVWFYHQVHKYGRPSIWRNYQNLTLYYGLGSCQHLFWLSAGRYEEIQISLITSDRELGMHCRLPVVNCDSYDRIQPDKATHHGPDCLRADTETPTLMSWLRVEFAYGIWQLRSKYLATIIDYKYSWSDEAPDGRSRLESVLFVLCVNLIVQSNTWLNFWSLSIPLLTSEEPAVRGHSALIKRYSYILLCATCLWYVIPLQLYVSSTEEQSVTRASQWSIWTREIPTRLGCRRDSTKPGDGTHSESQDFVGYL
jgi:hypothetical protein